MTTTKQPAIHAAMAAVMKDLSAIGKDGVNKSQGFKFRGIDQVYNELHPIMAKHQIITVPRDVEMLSRMDRQTSRGGTITFTLLKTKYDFMSGVDGSFVTVGPIVSEGMDSGDKGCAKAMAVAHKYALLQTFLVPTQDAVDGDVDTYTVAPDQPAGVQGNPYMGQPPPPPTAAPEWQQPAPPMFQQPPIQGTHNPPPLDPNLKPDLTPAQKGAITRAANKAAAEEKVEPDPSSAPLIIEDAEGAAFVATSLIQLIGMHDKDFKSLAEFWRLNKTPLDLLEAKFNSEYLRVKQAFTEARNKTEGK